MLRVWYSNSLERLVDRLVAVERDERRRLKLGPLDRSPVVIPGDNMGTYLQLQVARNSGIAARMQHWHIGNFFESLLPEDGTFRLLGRATLQFLLRDALCDDAFLGGEPLKRPRDYLAAVESDRDALELRRFQLSGHLARLFEEYQLNRPEMLARWAVGERDSRRDRPQSDLNNEVWQRALWLRIFGAHGVLEQYFEETGVRLLRPGELFERVPQDLLRVPPAVHFFGLDRVGRVFEGLLGQLGELCDVHIWAHNPCDQFWEDVVTDIDEEAELLSSKTAVLNDGGQASLLSPLVDETFWEPERFPLPLRLWGRAGRDQMRMFNRLCAYDPRMDFVSVDPQQSTALKQLQRDVLTLEYERDTPIKALQDSDKVDDSIAVMACPGIQREVEVVANEIWRLIQNDPTLGLNQIAIILNREQASLYHTQIEAVFRDVYDIPFNIRDMAASAAGRVFEAVELLLDLAFSDLKRRDFLRLLTHPNVAAKFVDIDPQTWIRWCDELHIVHGADHADHQDMYIDQDLFNWDQGLKRLVLGGFMTGAAASGDERIFEAADFDYLPHEFAHGDAESAAELVRTARALMRDARRCRDEKMSLRAWFEWIAELIERYLAPTDEQDEADIKLLRAALADLARVDPWDDGLSSVTDAEHLRSASNREVPYRTAREFVRGAIGNLDGHIGQYLIDGVSVSTFMPARPMPFRAIFCLGMGEANFPSSDAPDPLDLRRERWQEGDVTRRDLDKYAFFQALMAAGERFYVSYISRDSSTGEALEPSSVVQDLLRMLEQQYLGKEQTQACIRRHPLRRFDAAYFPEISSASELSSSNIGPNFHPEARREAAALALRESLREHFTQRADAGSLEIPDLSELRLAVAQPVRHLLDRVLGGYSPPVVQPPTQDMLEVSISLTQLRQFLESPLQASARWILGMRADEEEDLFDVDDEIFEAAYVDSLMLIRDVFTRAMARPDALGAGGVHGENPFAQIYDTRAKFLELRGELPTGVFFQEARKKHLESIDIWRENMTHLELPARGGFGLKRFGRARQRMPGDEVFDSIRVEVELAGAGSEAPRRARVEICGVSELLDAGCATALTPVLRGSVKDKDFLRGFLSHVALAAAGKGNPSKPFDAVILPAKSLKGSRSRGKYRRTFAPISQVDALGYLRTLAADFLSAPNAHAMPVEAVFDYFKPDNEVAFSELVEQQFANRWGACSAEFGPVRQPSRFSAPEGAEAIIARRFDPFFSRIIEDAGKA